MNDSRARVVLLFVVLACLSLAQDAPAQSSFTVTHAVARSTPTHVEIDGTVRNDARADALDVSVTVEALGAGGKVVSRGVSYVTSRIAEGATVAFTAKVPAVAGITGYRARVTSYRFLQAIQSP